MKFIASKVLSRKKPHVLDWTAHIQTEIAHSINKYSTLSKETLATMLDPLDLCKWGFELTRWKATYYRDKKRQRLRTSLTTKKWQHLYNRDGMKTKNALVLRFPGQNLSKNMKILNFQPYEGLSSSEPCKRALKSWTSSHMKFFPGQNLAKNAKILIVSNLPKKNK